MNEFQYNSIPFKKKEIALACAVICAYWDKINEYYRANKNISTTTSTADRPTPITPSNISN